MRTIADQLLAVAKQGKRSAPAIEWDTWWRATTAATHTAMMDNMATNNREEAAAVALPLSASGPNSAQPHPTGSTAPKILAAKIKNVIRDCVALALFVPALPF